MATEPPHEVSPLDAAIDYVEKVQEEHVKQRRARFNKFVEGKSKRFRRRAERMFRARSEYDIPKVRVVPRNQEMREIMVHPTGNIAFRETGSVEWPLDPFTERRLRDGDVMLEGQEAQAQRQARRATQTGGPRRTYTPPTGQTGSPGPSSPTGRPGPAE